MALRSRSPRWTDGGWPEAVNRDAAHGADEVRSAATAPDPPRLIRSESLSIRKRKVDAGSGVSGGQQANGRAHAQPRRAIFESELWNCLVQCLSI